MWAAGRGRQALAGAQPRQGVCVCVGGYPGQLSGERWRLRQDGRIGFSQAELLANMEASVRPENWMEVGTWGERRGRRGGKEQPQVAPSGWASHVGAWVGRGYRGGGQSQVRKPW